MKLNKSKILTFSLITANILIVNISHYTYQKNISEIDLQNENIFKNGETFIRNHNAYFQKYIQSIGYGYFKENVDFFKDKLIFKLNEINNLNKSSENLYYPINVIPGSKDGTAMLLFATNDESFNENELNLTFDYKENMATNNVNDKEANINYLYSPTKVFNYFYVYEIDDLVTNGTDYYDFNFYLNDENVYSSKKNNDTHYMTPYNAPMIINDVNIEDIDYPAIKIEIDTPPGNPESSKISSNQANGARLIYQSDNLKSSYKFLDMNFVWRDANNFNYEIYNVSPDIYKYIGIQTTSLFEYNYLDQEYYPLFYNNFSTVQGREKIVDIDYGINNRLAKIENINFYDNKESNTIATQITFNDENKHNISIDYYVTNDKTLDSEHKRSKTIKPIMSKSNSANGYYTYELHYESGYEYSDFNIYLDENNSSSYYLDDKYSADFSEQGEIVSAEIINTEKDKITFNITFQNSDILQMENIDVSYYQDGKLNYASDNNNLNLIKLVEKNENISTYQFELIDLNNEFTYSNFKIFLPINPMSQNNLIDSEYETSYKYNYENYDYNYEKYIGLKNTNYIYLLLIFPIIIFLIALLFLINKMKERRKIEKMYK